MDIEQLRQWVRGQLPPERRREVGRWMLRSGDPALPSVLQGLVREHEDELADAALRLRAPERGFVADLWRQLLDAGRATVQGLRAPELAGGAVLGTAQPTSGLVFRQLDGEVVIDVVIAGGSRTASVLATTDLGDEHVLLEPSTLEPGTYVDTARWTPEPSEGRVTLWLVLAPSGLEPAQTRPLYAVSEAMASEAVALIAARWTDPA